MAIQFARLQYVKRSSRQSACQKAAYNGRDKIYDLRQEKTFDFSKREDNVYHAIMLPEGVSAQYSNVAHLWNTIEAREQRADAQVAKEMVLALPDDAVITLDDRIALTRSFLKAYFVDQDIICQVDIHKPHSQASGSRWKKEKDHEEANDRNWHAHVLMPTRACIGEQFGLKARHLDVDVRKGFVVSTDKQWGVLWANHQNQYFKENGIDLVVDPVGIVPELYIKTRVPYKTLEALKEDSRDENARKAQDERLVLQHLLKNESQFDKRSVALFAEKHVNAGDRETFLGQFWASKEIVLVGEDKYTSKTVLREEQKMVRMADRLAGKAGFVIEPQYHIELNAAQKRVVDYVCAGHNLSCIEGRAGTGKSRALCAVRETYESAGFVVRGLAPTSSVADTMRKDDNFAYAANVQKFLFSQHHGQVDIQNGKEVWLVDEAAMVENPVMGELLDKAWLYDAKVVLIGDDKQLPAIGRGGAFKAFVARFDSMGLETIVRQKNDYHRVITEKIAEGKTTEALYGMAERGAWTHCSTEQEAVRGLMHAWYENYKKNPYESFTILEYRNQFVKVLNDNIHEVFKLRGDVGQEDVMVKTARYGFGAFSVGDKVVFRSNDKELGIHNGQRGFLMSAQPHEFVVRVDDVRDVAFDPQHYNDFQHGYAGTIHSAQGLTFDHVFSLHSSHVTQNLFYVANSRHRLSCHYFSYGDRERVCEDIARQEQKELCSESLEEKRSWLGSLVIGVVDYVSKNHEFYSQKHICQHVQGFLITDSKEQSRLQGYRTLYTEEQETWPILEGQVIKMSTQHRALESFLRAQGVGQCILLDADRKDAMLIGPYDRFHNFYQEQRAVFKVHDISEGQLRVRLFALEQQFKETPQSVDEMTHSRSFAQLKEHETANRSLLMKDFNNEHVVTQMFYHLEKTGSLPTGETLDRIQQRVESALVKFGVHQKDRIFEAALPIEVQKQIQFQKQCDRE